MTIARSYNFCSGPAMLPTEVLQQAQAELLNFQGQGSSVMEMSHRGEIFQQVHAQAKADLAELLALPADYEILFLQGGATAQFSQLAMNLLQDKADYIVTGQWGNKAVKAAKAYGQVNIAASTQSENFLRAPTQAELNLDPDASYVHYTPNETIGGVEFNYVPQTGAVPLIGDFSSTILSRPLDVSQFGMIYAGAQKNIGPSGLVVVIIRKDLLARQAHAMPELFSYAAQQQNDSMINTPPTFGIYLAGLVFQWLKRQGGLSAMAEHNQSKAEALYRFIDGHDFYHNPIAHDSRSWMNVPFTLADASLEKEFLRQSEAAGLHTLAGHRSVGGMRASIYNAMPRAGIDALTAFMADFAKRMG